MIWNPSKPTTRLFRWNKTNATVLVPRRFILSSCLAVVKKYFPAGNAVRR
ncbi:hypothetical protein NIASO_18835 [Niabella soli DSM 19437]|uniref:Uncharacterized protein n=1 Tax=Niabella soli DSM 19437 TaxID=929713 RepID=W0F4L8_9BACT|nr:hypothetical protein NIASO_18835 [Niabella soli DSM 19437]